MQRHKLREAPRRRPAAEGPEMRTMTGDSTAACRDRLLVARFRERKTEHRARVSHPTVIRIAQRDCPKPERFGPDLWQARWHRQGQWGRVYLPGEPEMVP